MKYLKKIFEDINPTKKDTETAMSILKEISYIIEDEGISLDIWESGNGFVVVDINNVNHSNQYKKSIIREQDFYKEYIDRVSDELKNTGWYIYINPKSEDKNGSFVLEYDETLKKNI